MVYVKSSLYFLLRRVNQFLSDVIGFSFWHFFFLNKHLPLPLYYLLVSDEHKQSDGSFSVDILTAVSQQLCLSMELS